MSILPRPQIQAPGSLSDRAYREIRDGIIRLEYQPGTPLAEEELMQQLSLGRTPVREAIKRLALESLVDIYPRRGTFVSEIQITDLAAISEVRREIEGYAAKLAAKRFDPNVDGELLSDLKDSFGQLDPTDMDDLMRVDAEVHRFVYRAARNHYLEDTLTRYYNLSFRIWRLAMTMQRQIEFSVTEHLSLLEAVEAGDGQLARQTACQHVVDFEAEMRAAF